MPSFATVTPTNLDLGICRVTYGGTDLGATLDNVIITINRTKAEIKADQLGTTVVDRKMSGTMMQVATSLAEVKNLDDVWKAVFPSADLVIDGVDPTKKYMDFRERICFGDQANALPLLLHPLCNDDADVTGDFLFDLVIASEESEFTFGPEEQQRLKLVWNVLPDLSVSPARFLRYGDVTATP
jgi:hypothetical protein